MNVCVNCGSELQQGALICRNCGSRVSGNIVAVTKSDGKNVPKGKTRQSTSKTKSSKYCKTKTDVSLGDWIVSMLLTLVPVLNVILVIRWAFGKNIKPSKKTYFQFYIIILLLSMILMGMLKAIGFESISSFIR